MREEAPFYWVKLGGGWWNLFIYVQIYAGVWLEFHFMVQALPEGWSSRSSYFIGVVGLIL